MTSGFYKGEKALDGLSQWRFALCLFGALAALLAALNGGALLGMMSVWWNTTTYNHGFFILPVSLWLIWRRRAELAQAAPAPDPLALVPLGLGALAMALGRIADIDILQHGAFALMLMALFPLCFGRAFAKRFWFPILFLGFMTPAGDFLIPWLQELTADVSVWMLRASGIPTFRSGVLIELPNSLFEVAEACAGLRFLIANLVIAALFAYFSYDRPWKWALFALLAVAAPVLGNCLRAYGVMMIAHLSSNRLAMGVDHLVYGWVFFLAIMLFLLWLGGLFADRRIEDPAYAPLQQQGAGRFGVIALGAALMALAPLGASLAKPVPAPLPPSMPQAFSAGWSRTAPPVDWVPPFTADALFLQSYEKDGARIDVMLAFYTHQRSGYEATHYANRFDDSEIWLRAQSPRGAVIGGAPVLIERLTSARGAADRDSPVYRERLVAARWWAGGALGASPARAKLDELRARLMGGPSSAAVLAVSSEGPEARDMIAAYMRDLGDPAPVLRAMENGAIE